MNDIGAGIISDTLTVHTVGVVLAEDTATNVVTLRWSLEVTNPEKFLPLWTKFAKSIESYDWSATHMVSSHIIWQ